MNPDPATLPLSSLRPGQRGRLVTLDAAPDLRTRWLAMGLRPGVVVECLRSAPLGDPVLYRAGGSLLALRRADTRGMGVEPLTDAAPAP
jgi:Fe2+ transport system protein FeoA